MNPVLWVGNRNRATHYRHEEDGKGRLYAKVEVIVTRLDLLLLLYVSLQVVWLDAVFLPIPHPATLTFDNRRRSLISHQRDESHDVALQYVEQNNEIDH